MSIEEEREMDEQVARSGGVWMQTAVGRVWITKELWEDGKAWRAMGRFTMVRRGYS